MSFACLRKPSRDRSRRKTSAGMTAFLRVSRWISATPIWVRRTLRGSLGLQSHLGHLDWPLFDKTLLLSPNPLARLAHFRRAHLDYTAPERFLGRPLFDKALLPSPNPSPHPFHFRRASRDDSARQHFLGQPLFDKVLVLSLNP